jgi:hypothetical protein
VEERTGTRKFGAVTLPFANFGREFIKPIGPFFVYVAGRVCP